MGQFNGMKVLRKELEIPAVNLPKGYLLPSTSHFTKKATP